MVGWFEHAVVVSPETVAVILEPWIRTRRSLLVEARTRYESCGSIRPEALNAANAELHNRLANVWAELEGDPGYTAIVLTSSGEQFCAQVGDMGLLQAMHEDEAIRAAIFREGRQ